MVVFDFFHNQLGLTNFSAFCLCLAICLIIIAVLFLIIGIATHESYANNKTSYTTCHLFIMFAQIAWIVLLVLFSSELIVNFANIGSEANSGIVFMLKFIIYLTLIAGLVELARRIFSNDGRYVGHVTPYEKFCRFMKPLFWRD